MRRVEDAADVQAVGTKGERRRAQAALVGRIASDAPHVAAARGEPLPIAFAA